MPVQVAADNDVLLKGACYRLLVHFLAELQEHGIVGTLGAAKFVVTYHLQTLDSVTNRQAALAEFQAFMESAAELEPTDPEIALATTIEEEAQRAGVEVDTGESQLCAIVIQRGIPILLTGDKRAIEGLEVVVASVPGTAPLHGSIGSLEQFILTAAHSLGLEEVRTRVCAELHVDQAVSISFTCNSDSAMASTDGLASYIHDLRTRAPTLLVPTDLLTWEG